MEGKGGRKEDCVHVVELYKELLLNRAEMLWGEGRKGRKEGRKERRKERRKKGKKEGRKEYKK